MGRWSVVDRRWPVAVLWFCNTPKIEEDLNSFEQTVLSKEIKATVAAICWYHYQNGDDYQAHTDKVFLNHNCYTIFFGENQLAIH